MSAPRQLKSRLPIRILVLAQAVVTGALISAGPASAQSLFDPGTGTGVPAAPASQSVVSASLSSAQWALFAVMLVIALVVGAALAALTHRLRETHMAGHRTA